MAGLSSVDTRFVRFLFLRSNSSGAPCSHTTRLSVCAAVSTVLWIFIWFQARTTTQPVATTLFTPEMAAPSSSRCGEQLHDAAQVLSDELVIRGVYFDRRRRGGYSNTIAYLVEGSTLTKKRFLGCRVGQHMSKKVDLLTVRERSNGGLAVVHCYNVPGIRRNGDSAVLFYKTSTHLAMKVSSPKPLFIPEQRAQKARSATVVVCMGMVRSGEHSPSDHGLLYHWLRYHKTVGVDHVHMFTENNFVREGGLQNEVVKQALREGYLSIDFWPNWLTFDVIQDIKHSQMLAYQGCLYHFQGVYDYVVYADSDDFFVPVRKNSSLKYYLKHWCSEKISSCKFIWRQYYPECGWNPELIETNGNVTGAVTYNRMKDRTVPKSAHQLRAVLSVGIHNPKSVWKGYEMPHHRVPAKEAYFAHIRFGSLPEGGC